MITIELPPPQAEVRLLPANWKELTKKYTVAPKKEKGVFGNVIGEPGEVLYAHSLPVEFKWHGGKAPYKLTIRSAQGDYNKTISNLQVPHATVSNLYVATKYQWEVTDAAGECKSATFSTEEVPRLISMPDQKNGPVNIRDCGGYKSSFGGRMRQGLLYRCAAINDFMPSTRKNMIYMLEELKVRTEIDMRYPNHVVGRYCSELGPYTNWFHHPINAYKYDTLPEQPAIWRDTIARFAQPELYPIFFHCSGGVDRTGEIAFLLEALCGVSPEDLFTDYELSSLSGFPRPRSMGYFQKWLRYISSFSPLGSSYCTQAENYMKAIGITQAQIDSIRRILLDKGQ